ncbi:hypothetical protein [Streptomyces canus]|uniref:hypothetical protein n=1 Tax=Streptomyces canus TaxID=58343 RepID=UPI0033ACDC6A
MLETSSGVTNTSRHKANGFEVVITNNTKQLSKPLEVAAVAQSGLHRIEYRQNNKHGGLVGLGAAIATVCEALPRALSELEAADGQRLISLTSIDPTRPDPAEASPDHGPGRRPAEALAWPRFNCQVHQPTGRSWLTPSKSLQRPVE